MIRIVTKNDNMHKKTFELLGFDNLKHFSPVMHTTTRKMTFLVTKTVGKSSLDGRTIRSDNGSPAVAHRSSGKVFLAVLSNPQGKNLSRRFW